ncbi:uncharacterized protein L969DRAFT_606840 [Mixia osmundae IAM 14324]|uniref:MYND-type domain-containing protein n=1 Tax=Mixia osmundae (strain CBS 9802 / IAM 14324 / JCM 22182 / KY 12970) TaxID=764103 RepID=G7E361_MIXOS|nr:uncharacterized protein L969DRAFT_606840 [Mixia osmundae IAM 14324]KEI42470.1 hypothetical protein L969DRAFT_606840 [Mixia osmundae IAM 14324]GAA97242.1 hypothetical protein E5Q_03919 [Mixia osmundae IAM 14324]
MGDKVKQLIELGFDEASSKAALQRFPDSIERAVDWIFNNPSDNLDGHAWDPPAPTLEYAPPAPSRRTSQDYTALDPQSHAAVQAALQQTALNQTSAASSSDWQDSPAYHTEFHSGTSEIARNFIGPPNLTRDQPLAIMPPAGQSDARSNTWATPTDDDDEMEAAIRASLRDQQGINDLVDETTMASNLASWGQPNATQGRFAGPGSDNSDHIVQASLLNLPSTQSHTTASQLRDGQHALRTLPSERLVRSDLDRPMVVHTFSPHTALLAPLLIGLYELRSFRQAVLSLDFGELASDDIDTDYWQGGAISEALNIRMAALPAQVRAIASLQRLFAFMALSHRAIIVPNDLLSTISDLPPRERDQAVLPTVTAENPVVDMTRVFEAIADAWSYTCEYHAKLAIDAGQDSAQVEQLLWNSKSILFHRGQEGNEDHPQSILDASARAALDIYHDPKESSDVYMAHAQSRSFACEEGMSLTHPANTVVMPIRRPGANHTTFSDIEPLTINLELFLDRYLYGKRQAAQQLREQADQKRKAKVVLQDKLKAIKDPDGNDHIELMEKTRKYLFMISQECDDDERQARQQKIIANLEIAIAHAHRAAEYYKSGIATLQTELDGLYSGEEWSQCGPYQLRAMLLHTGPYPKHDAYHTYICRQDRWWRIVESDISAVHSLESQVLNTNLGVMIGSGPCFLLYERQSAPSLDSVRPNLASIIAKDNAVLAAEHDLQLHASSLPQPAEQVDDVAMAVEDAILPVSVAGAAEEVMQLRGGSLATKEPNAALRESGRGGDDDDEDDEDEQEGLTGVELGFAEPIEKSLDPVAMVGKLGGAPLWLNPALPLSPDMTQCGVCRSRAMRFLLQLNAPVVDSTQAPYRAIYVYTCPNGRCVSIDASRATRAWRIQLAEGGPFGLESGTAGSADVRTMRQKCHAVLCAHCHLRASHRCSLCNTERYCSKECQAARWPLHKPRCQNRSDQQGEQDQDQISAKQWKAFEIVSESEWIDQEKESVPSMLASTPSDLAHMANVDEPDTDTGVDGAFLRFQHRLSNEPEQILRYNRAFEGSVEPLWVSSTGKPKPEAISTCPICDGARTCEFQIMSTVLGMIGVDDTQQDSLDFGTLLVYTCQAACQIPLKTEPTIEGTATSGWAQELIIAQNFTSQGMKSLQQQQQRAS